MVEPGNIYMANTRPDNVRSLKYLLCLFACCLLSSNAYDMLNIIFIKCFFSKCLPRKIAKFCGLKANFHTCFDIFPNMHQIALQSIQSPSKLRATPFDFKSHGIHGQIFSFGRNWSHKSLDPPLTSSLALKVFLLFSFYVVTIFIVCMKCVRAKVLRNLFELFKV